jgi:hypothetical protein
VVQNTDIDDADREVQGWLDSCVVSSANIESPPSQEQMIAYLKHVSEKVSLQDWHIDYFDRLPVYPFLVDGGLSEEFVLRAQEQHYASLDSKSIVRILFSPIAMIDVFGKGSDISTVGDCGESAADLSVPHMFRSLAKASEKLTNTAQTTVLEGAPDEFSLAKESENLEARCYGMTKVISSLEGLSAKRFRQHVDKLKEIQEKAKGVEGVEFGRLDTKFHELLEGGPLGTDESRKAVQFAHRFKDIEKLRGHVRDVVWQEHQDFVELLDARNFKDAYSAMCNHLHQSSKRWSKNLTRAEFDRSRNLFERLREHGGVLVFASWGVDPIEYSEAGLWLTDTIAECVIRGAKFAYLRPSQKLILTQHDASARSYGTDIDSDDSIWKEFISFQGRVRDAVCRLDPQRSVGNQAMKDVSSSIELFRTETMDLYHVVRPGRTLGLFCFDDGSMQLTERARPLAEHVVSPELQLLPRRDPLIQLYGDLVQMSLNRCAESELQLEVGSVARHVMTAVRFGIDREFRKGVKQ